MSRRPWLLAKAQSSTEATQGRRLRTIKHAITATYKSGGVIWIVSVRRRHAPADANPTRQAAIGKCNILSII